MAFYSHQLLTSDLFKTFWKASVSGAGSHTKDAPGGPLYRIRRPEALAAFHHIINGVETLQKLVDGKLDLSEAEVTHHGRTRQHAADTPIPVEAVHSLVVPSRLMLGIVRIYHIQGLYLVQDCEHALVSISRPRLPLTVPISPATKRARQKAGTATGVLLPDAATTRQLELQMPDEEDILGQDVLYGLLQPVEPGLASSGRAVSVAASLMDVVQPKGSGSSASVHVLQTGVMISPPSGLRRAASVGGGLQPSSFPPEDELFDVAADLQSLPELDILSQPFQQFDLHEEEEEQEEGWAARAAGLLPEYQYDDEREQARSGAEPKTPPPSAPVPGQPPTTPTKPGVHEADAALSRHGAVSSSVRRQLFTSVHHMEDHDEVWDELHALDVTFEHVYAPTTSPAPTPPPAVSLTRQPPAERQAEAAAAGEEEEESQSELRDEAHRRMEAEPAEEEHVAHVSAPALSPALRTLLNHRKRLKPDKVSDGDNGLLSRAEVGALLDNRSRLIRSPLMRLVKAQMAPRAAAQAEQAGKPRQSPQRMAGSLGILPAAQSLLPRVMQLQADGHAPPLSTVLSVSGLVAADVPQPDVSKAEQLMQLLFRRPRASLAPRLQPVIQRHFPPAAAVSQPEEVESEPELPRKRHRRQATQATTPPPAPAPAPAAAQQAASEVGGRVEPQLDMAPGGPLEHELDAELPLPYEDMHVPEVVGGARVGVGVAAGVFELTRQQSEEWLVMTERAMVVEGLAPHMPHEEQESRAREAVVVEEEEEGPGGWVMDRLVAQVAPLDLSKVSKVPQPLPGSSPQEMTGILSERLMKVAGVYQATLRGELADDVPLSRFMTGAKRIRAARLFVDTLTLMSCGVVHLEQQEEDVLISSAGEQLD